MSKKKAFSGSTMTLKDFHGGSIPSDLPLPSAPGVVVRPSDHRQVANPSPTTGRSDNQRGRPASASASAGANPNRSNNHSHPPHINIININIGRNFDEDERKPLDGVSLPRRTVSDHAPPPPLPRFDPTKPQTPPTPNPNPTPAPTPRFSNRSPPNAWGPRKDVPDPNSNAVQSSTWSGPNAVSRFAQASALEKVSSGRWQQSKPPIPELQVADNDEVDEVDRPKIKLLPRSRPLEPSSIHQGYQPPLEITNDSHAPRPTSAGSAVERPRLNLKPRSQPLQLSHQNERNLLFGGARPRELVLKERGVDEVVINSLDSIQPPNRVKDDHPKTEIKQDPAASTPMYGDKAENFLHDQKIGKNNERKDQRADSDRPEQRGSRRNESWRNNREPEKQQQQQERRPELESWRKPVEQPNSSSSDAVGVRYGKAASALELAQAFSGSNSGPRTGDRSLSGQKGVPGRNQVPFSRLTDTREFYSSSTPRRQINGY